MSLPPTSHGAGVIRAALSYAALGWHVLPVHGISPDGSCTCGDRHDGGRERTRGKHPSIRDWQNAATTDEEAIVDWFERGPLLNVGMVLGPLSGVWDLEYDSAEGEATVNRLCQGLITPTYRSGRSVHRLLRWSAHLPAVTKLVVQGAEARLGAGGRGAMSVMPPSRHWSGGSYQWLPSLSPGECDVAETPDSVLLLLTQGETLSTGDGGAGGLATGSGGSSLILPNGATRARQALVLETIDEGGRNDTLFAFACREASRSRDITHPREQGDLFEKVAAINLLKCRPPIGDEEMRRLVESAITYAMRQPNSGTAETLRQRVPSELEHLDGGELQTIRQTTEIVVEPAASPRTAPPTSRPTTLVGHGLERRGDSWGPGTWELQIVCSDPPSYRLHVPAWEELTADRTGDVLLSLDEFMDAGRMARKVLLVTKSVLLESMPRAWAAIWSGSKGQIGLRTLLLQTAEEVAAPPTEQALLVAAEILLDSIEQAEETDSPADHGAIAKVIGEGGAVEYWLRWHEFWRRPIEQGKITRQEHSDLARRIGLGRDTAKAWRFKVSASGQRKRFAVLDAQTLECLRSLVG